MPFHFKSSFFLLTVTVACIVFIFLGNWQLQRLQWKIDLIERVETRVNASPIAAPLKLQLSEISKQDHEYLRVFVKGQFQHEHETTIQAVAEIGPGYWVMTPLISEDKTVLVNRGFVPEEYKEASTREDSLVAGEVEIIGLLRLTEPEGQLFRKNVSDEERWYSRDVYAIAKARGLEQVVPFFIDVEKTESSVELPVAGMTRIHFNNNHLVYAVTWYGLAILLLFMSYKALNRNEE